MSSYKKANTFLGNKAKENNWNFYVNAKNTCDFSREMNWHDYFTKMIAF